MSTTYHRLNPVRFLLNRPTDDQPAGTSPPPVEAPAFSLTKVTALIASLIGPAVAGITKAFTDASFTTAQYTVMFVGLVGFLAVAVAADVIARAVASSAAKAAQAAVEVAKAAADSAALVARHESSTSADLRDTVIHFDDPMPATLARSGPDARVLALAFASAGGGRFLVADDERRLSWVAADRLSFAPVPERTSSRNGR